MGLHQNHSRRPGVGGNAMKPRLARFLVTYRIGPRSYTITLPGVSASHIWRIWDRPGSTLIDVRECDTNGLPL